MQKIKFQSFSINDEPVLKPFPAIQQLPEWYKKLAPYTQGKKQKYFSTGQSNLTIKRCNPVGDALASGYFIVLENDLSVTPHESGTPELIWFRGGNQFITEHSKAQISPDIIPQGFSGQPFKFHNAWSIQTPKGYSVMITHPLNRHGEPFLTLAGVVDTDTYHNPIQFPFLIREDFEGIIEAGTPIAQVIPFKRESWKMEFLEHSKEFIIETQAAFSRTMNRYYKRFHWKRKEYK